MHVFCNMECKVLLSRIHLIFQEQLIKHLSQSIFSRCWVLSSLKNLLLLLSAEVTHNNIDRKSADKRNENDGSGIHSLKSLCIHNKLALIDNMWDETKLIDKRDEQYRYLYEALPMFGGLNFWMVGPLKLEDRFNEYSSLAKYIYICPINFT